MNGVERLMAQLDRDPAALSPTAPSQKMQEPACRKANFEFELFDERSMFGERRRTRIAPPGKILQSWRLLASHTPVAINPTVTTNAKPFTIMRCR
jgi:hypothetical protein